MALDQSALDALGLSVEYTSFKVELTDPKDGMPLVDQSDKDNPIIAYIEVDGFNSDAGEQIRKAALLEAQRKAKGGFRERPADLDEVRLKNAKNLAVLTKSWVLVNAQTRTVIAEDAFPCTYENALALYSREGTAWIAGQVSAAIAEESNFIKA